MFRRYPTLKQVIVSTKSERSFRGVLWRRRWGYLVLRNVEMLRERGEVTPMTGEVVILTENIDFMQVIG